MNMDRLLRIFIFPTILTAFALPAHALGHLSAQMRLTHEAPHTQPPFKSGEIELTLRNTGDMLIEVVMDDLPYTNSRTGTTRPMFVVSSDGTEAGFTGRIVDYIDKDVSTTAIAPGREVKIRFNIYRSYRLEAEKTYTVEFRSPIRYLNRPSGDFTIASRLDLLPIMEKAHVNPLVIRPPRSLDEQQYSQARRTPPY